MEMKWDGMEYSAGSAVTCIQCELKEKKVSGRPVF